MRILLGLALGAAVVQLAPAVPVDQAEFQEQVAPVIERRCVACHGPAAQNAGVRLDNLSTDLRNDRRAAETWHDVLNALNRGKMPPKGAPSLDSAERTALVGWLTTEIRRAAAARRSTDGKVVMRRLNRVEYQNTMRDLLGLDLDYTRNLPPDELSSDGFNNNGAALRMSALQLEYYLAAAREGLRYAIVQGEAPAVAELTEVHGVVDKEPQTNWTTRLGRNGVFAARTLAFPDEGEFQIKIRAHAEFPSANSPFPRAQVRLGYRADTQTPSRIVGAVDVVSETSREYLFTGRIESFPRQSRTQSKYPGLLIWVRNVYSDGKPNPEGEQVEQVVNGKKKKAWVFEEDPNFPKIVIESLEFVSPVYSNWPPEHHRQLVPFAPGGPEDERRAARAALKRFMPRAFRRPVSGEEVDSVLAYFDEVRVGVDSFEVALRETLALVLVSPDFLYRVETEEAGQDGLNEHELAARLSYFLWSTMPDETLRVLADSARLSDPKTVAEQTNRLLDDERSWAFVEEFTNQWLDLGGVDRIAINPNYYPDFDPALKAQMQQETREFFRAVLRDDLSALNLLRSDFAVVNQPLASHYGFAGPRGSGFERVGLPEGQSGGLLSQGSILLSNSTGEDSHPIERGVWIRSALLNDPPPPPPPAVPNLDGSGDTALLPLKRQLEMHLDNEACASCHVGIDPWGIALEDYDAVGLLRDEILRHVEGEERLHPVDAAASLPDGTRLDGAESLKRYLVGKKSEEFARAVTEKMLTYALGRSLEFSDAATVEELTANFVASGYKLRSLITMIVTSEPFLGR